MSKMADRMFTDAYIVKDLPFSGRKDPIDRKVEEDMADLLTRLGVPEGADVKEALTFVEGKEEEARKALREIHLERNKLMGQRKVALDKYRANIQKMLTLVPVVDIQNVYHLCRERASKQEWDVYDLPCLAPKWDAAWFEYRQNNGQSVGILAGLEEEPEGGYRPIGEPDSQTGANGLVRWDKFWTSDNLPTVEAWEPVKWVWGLDFFQEHERKIYGPLLSLSIAVDEYGRALDITYGGMAVDVDSQAEDYVGIVLTWGTAMSLLNCRNVETVYQRPPDKVSKKFEKKSGRPLTGWRSIRVDLPGARTVQRSSPSGDGEEVAFHIAPGSFAHYGQCCSPDVHPPKGLLFGKYTGIVWRDMHVKGNPKHGVAVADYEIGRL